MILFAFMVVGFASGGAFVSTLGAGIKLSLRILVFFFP